MSNNLDDTAQDLHTTSTGHALSELQLHGYRPFEDEPDPRPLPDAQAVVGAVSDVFDAFASTLQDTRLEPDLEDLLWSTVNLFHRAAERIERQLDANEQAQKRSQAAQDGSEIRSVELERLIAEGLTLLERRNAMELFRDQATEHFSAHTGSHWHPRAGSLVSHRTMTASMIDSRDFISAKRRADTELLIPKGTKIAFAGGVAFNDHWTIWSVLDKVHAKYPDMILLHTANIHGADAIAASWAASRKVVQIPFKPKRKNATDRAAPYKRNDLLLECMPQGLIVFPGTGIVDNLYDKAYALGIGIADYRHLAVAA